MHKLIKCTILLACVVYLSMIDGCDFGAHKGIKHNVIKTSHNKIAERFTSNCDEASEYYNGKIVCLSGVVNDIYEFGTVVLVNGQNDHFNVHFAEDSRQELINMKVGDNLTVSCKKVSKLHIGECEVMK